MPKYESWGRHPRGAPHSVIEPVWRDALPSLEGCERRILPFGRGRSYGDVCQNEGGVLIDTASLSRFIAFDRATGVLACEAGVTLAEVLQLSVPNGWFLPVTPGTKFVTVAGAIANDVHGKNHHRGGTFGHHVLSFELVRSDGERIVCSPEHDRDLFRATIGGMGLTGLIVRAEIQLKPIRSAYVDVDVVRFGNLDEFLEISGSQDAAYEYTVAWIDGLARGDRLARGVYFLGNWRDDARDGLVAHSDPRLVLPVDAPSWALNPLSIRAFNFAYYWGHPSSRSSVRRHYDPFFYPLDSIGDWNRVYGRRGFLQYQCVVPSGPKGGAIRHILELIAASGKGSCLNVLKTFGELESPGLMSFVRPGITLAIDFANDGASTLALLDRLDEVVVEAGGAVYPAKDARMSATRFRRFFPRWKEFERFVDPGFSSGFWRRVRNEA